MKIAVINIYYGQFPNYFKLWLQSANRNVSIDFYIIGDKFPDLEYGDNIYLITIPFDKLKKRIKHYFGKNSCLKTPYKICDYKPAFGLIFHDLISKYDFWGHCDFDMIFGDIRAFLTDEILRKYDKFYSHGHFTLYRNQDKMNRLFLKNHKFVAFTWKEAFSTNIVCHFDEWRGNSVIALKSHVRCYDKPDFADINRLEYQFRLELGNRKRKPYVFVWDNGHLYGYSVEEKNVLKKEYLYIHLQKRDMILGNIQNDYFNIIPNYFVSANRKPNVNFITRYGKKNWWYPKKFKIYIRAMKELIVEKDYKLRLILLKKYLREKK